MAQSRPHRSTLFVAAHYAHVGRCDYDRCQHPDSIVGQIRDVNVPGGIHGDSRGIQMRARGRSAIAGIGGRSSRSACNGCDESAGRDAPHNRIAIIRDVEIACAIQGHPSGKSDPSRHRRSAIARVTGNTGTGYGGNGSVQSYLADAAVQKVGYVEIALTVYRAIERVESRVERWTIIAGVAEFAVAGNGSDDTRGNGDFADSAIRVIREVDVARG